MIRVATAADAAELAAVERALVEDGRGEVRTVDDLSDVPTLAARLEDGDTLVAVVAGRIEGSASLGRLGPSRLRHVGSLSVGVHPRAQGRGLGRALVLAVLEVARDRGLHRLELYVRADNHRAIALYRSVGFEVESVRRDFVQRDDGSWLDDLCMVCFDP